MLERWNKVPVRARTRNGLHCDGRRRIIRDEGHAIEVRLCYFIVGALGFFGLDSLDVLYQIW